MNPLDGQSPETIPASKDLLKPKIFYFLAWHKLGLALWGAGSINNCPPKGGRNCNEGEKRGKIEMEDSSFNGTTTHVVAPSF
jgi:hypothetical protein